jgi:hypothetical protein
VVRDLRHEHLVRREPRRNVRAFIVTTFCLITVASVYRVRADVWSHDNLINGDRYFYMPRVLLAWLFIFEFDARPRAVAWLARGIATRASLRQDS